MLCSDYNMSCTQAREYSFAIFYKWRAILNSIHNTEIARNFTFTYDYIISFRKYTCYVSNYNTCMHSHERIFICNILLMKKWSSIQFIVLKRKTIPPFIYGCIISVRNYLCFVLNYNTCIKSRETILISNIILIRKWS